MRLLIAILGAIALLFAAQVLNSQVLPGITPASLDMEYGLNDVDGNAAHHSMNARISFFDDTGEYLYSVQIGDLKPFLTTQEKQQLAAIMARLRTSAEGFYLE